MWKWHTLAQVEALNSAVPFGGINCCALMALPVHPKTGEHYWNKIHCFQSPQWEGQRKQEKQVSNAKMQAGGLHISATRLTLPTHGAQHADKYLKIIPASQCTGCQMEQCRGDSKAAPGELFWGSPATLPQGWALQAASAQGQPSFAKQLIQHRSETPEGQSSLAGSTFGCFHSSWHTGPQGWWIMGGHQRTSCLCSDPKFCSRVSRNTGSTRVAIRDMDKPEPNSIDPCWRQNARSNVLCCLCIVPAVQVPLSPLPSLSAAAHHLPVSVRCEYLSKVRYSERVVLFFSSVAVLALESTSTLETNGLANINMFFNILFLPLQHPDSFFSFREPSYKTQQQLMLWPICFVWQGAAASLTLSFVRGMLMLQLQSSCCSLLPVPLSIH